MSPSLRLMLLLVAVVIEGCTPREVAPTGMPIDEAKAKLAACTYGAKAMPRDTLPGDTKLGSAMPIDHFVLVMQENRSFDHYLSGLSHGGVAVARPDATNPDRSGVARQRYHETKYCMRDVNHSWEGSHRQFNNGKMDGFVVTNEPDGQRAMAWYDEHDLPFYYALARTFAISDMHFSSVMGPTQPNRLYYFAATSFGATANALPPARDVNGRPTVNLFTRLNDAHVGWNAYVSDVASPAVFVPLLASNLDNFKAIDAFFTDAAAGTLPSVSIVEATFTAGVKQGQTDEHPASNIQQGQAFTARVVNAVMTSPQWARTALILLYDEHGGFYDSVPPPKSCEPDDLRPAGDPDRRFDHLGFRSPLMVVSPYARRGYVSHEPVEHTAVTRLLEARFDLPAMTRRDANAWPLLDLFDFEHPDIAVPQLPPAYIDPMRDEECRNMFE